MKLRSQQRFDSPDNPGMTALCIERHLNFGITREELQSGKARLEPMQACSDDRDLCISAGLHVREDSRQSLRLATE